MVQFQQKASSSCSLPDLSCRTGPSATSTRPRIRFSTLGFFHPNICILDLIGGNGSRLPINATPFFIPLLFQVGFGIDAIATGTYILVYFAGNLAMKTVTTPLLRRFGFPTILVVNGVIASASIAACAVLSPTTPQPAIYALLFLAGLSRSMQFTALNTVGFADISPAAQRSSASTLSSMLQQLSMVLGVAVAAAVLSVFQTLRRGISVSLVDFRWAFIAIGAIGMLASLRFRGLEKDAGSEVSRHSRRTATKLEIDRLEGYEPATPILFRKYV